MAPGQERIRTLPVALSSEALRVLGIGLASGLLYLVVYLAQRAIHYNGLRVAVAKATVSGAPADWRRLALELGLYVAATVALFALYGLLLGFCRQGRLRERRARRLALAFPLLFNLGLLFGRPYLSIDVFSYIAHGFLSLQARGGAYLYEARTVADTPFALQLLPYGWRPAHGFSPYGPIWTHIEIAVMSLTDSIPLAVFLLKLPVVVASFCAAVVIWRILGQVRPEDQLLGTLAYLWNPLIVVEFAAEGHNDPLMILFVLLAVLMAIQARPAATLLMLALGILTKYLPVLLVPAHLVYLWRTAGDRRLLLVQLLPGVLGSAALAALLYWPVWVGAQTFEGMRVSSQPAVIASISGVLFWYLSQLGATAAAQIVSRVLSALFLGYLLIASARVRDAERLLKACASIALIYVLLGAPVYWPWYSSLPIALMALSPRGAFGWMLLALPLCARLVAPIEDIMVNRFVTWETEVQIVTAIGVILPLLLFILLSIAPMRPARRPDPRSP